MPTLNLGRVRFNWRGQYVPETPYLEYDCVEDDGQSYVCIADVTGTGPNDTGGGTYWSSMLIRSADYNQARQDAIDAAAAASDSATAAGQSATTAGNSATAASNSATKADKWANEAEDVEVEPAKFSAYHWYKKAEAFGDPNQFNITADQTTDTRTMAGWAAQTRLNQNNKMAKSANLSDLTDKASARANLDVPGLSGANDFDTMPTVGGAPIVESGSNSDGEWTRWADGTQESLQEGARVSTSTDPLGSVYSSDMLAWSYPMAFNTTPIFSGCCRYGGGGGQTSISVTGVGVTSTRAYFRVLFPSSGEVSDQYPMLSAKGRYK